MDFTDRAKLIKNGPVSDAYAANGAYQGWLGYPSSDVIDRPSGGQYAHFANGSIFHNPLFGSFTVADDFRRQHQYQGRCRWLAGIPRRRRGRKPQWGMVACSASTRRHLSPPKWARGIRGWPAGTSTSRWDVRTASFEVPASAWGLPVRDEPARDISRPLCPAKATTAGRSTSSAVTSSCTLPSRAVYFVAGPFRDRYEAVGRTRFGLPTSDPQFGTQTFGHDYWYQSFEHGCIATCTTINTLHSFDGACDISRIEDLCD